MGKDSVGIASNKFGQPTTSEENVECCVCEAFVKSPGKHCSISIYTVTNAAFYSLQSFGSIL